jgi:hypothetical protein
MVVVREERPCLQPALLLLSMSEERLLKRLERTAVAEEVTLVLSACGDEVDAGVTETMERSVRPVHAAEVPSADSDRQVFYRT